MTTLLSQPLQLHTSMKIRRRRSRPLVNAAWYNLLDISLLAYTLLNGILNVPASISKTAGIFTTIYFWIGVTIILLRYPLKIRWDLWTCRFAFVFLVYTSASVFWGTKPANQFLYPIGTATLSFLYFNYLIEHKSTYEFSRLMLWASAILLFASIFTALFVPGIGIDSGIADPNNRGAWQGIFGQKNQLGIATSLATAFSLGQRSRNSVDRLLRSFVFLAAIVCAKGSQSREAWLAIALQIFAMSALFLVRRVKVASRPPVVFVGTILSVAIGLVIYFKLDAALAFLDRSPTASGRTNIWRDSLLLVGRRPLLGYGTYGVWKTPFAWTVVVREGWNVPSSHNNYVEILLYYGVIGLILYAPILLSGFVYMYRAALSKNLAGVQVHIYVLLGLAALSMASPLILYYPAIGMLAMLYSTSRLEEVDRPQASLPQKPKRRVLSRFATT